MRIDNLAAKLDARYHIQYGENFRILIDCEAPKWTALKMAFPGYHEHEWDCALRRTAYLNTK
jgi:hypothetical protein